jgi:hypothetical protein
VLAAQRGGRGGRAASGSGGLSRFCFVVRRIHDFRLGLGRGCGADFDFARLQEFRKLADKIDRQQAVLQLGAGDANVVGEAEAALKAALGNAAMQKVALLDRFALTGDEE